MTITRNDISMLTYQTPHEYKYKYIASSGYSLYIEYMESIGWRLKHTTLTEKDTHLVTVQGCDIATTCTVVDVRCPNGQKISIMGTGQVPLGELPTCAYTLGVKLCSSCDVEISPDTSIRITKEEPTVDVVQLARVNYSDISITDQTEGGVKDKSEMYRFSQGIEINGEQHFYVYTVAQADTGECSLPDVAIDSEHINFSLEVDRWTA